METQTDRFLRHRYGTRWVIETMGIPRGIPAEVRIEKISREANTRGNFTHRLVTDSLHAYESIVHALTRAAKLFSATVIERPGLVAQIVNRPGSRSHDALWLCVVLCVSALGLRLSLTK